MTDRPRPVERLPRRRDVRCRRRRRAGRRRQGRERRRRRRLRGLRASSSRSARPSTTSPICAGLTVRRVLRQGRRDGRRDRRQGRPDGPQGRRGDRRCHPVTRREVARMGLRDPARCPARNGADAGDASMTRRCGGDAAMTWPMRPATSRTTPAARHRRRDDQARLIGGPRRGGGGAMSVRPIVMLGDARLRLKGKPVDSFGKYLARAARRPRPDHARRARRRARRAAAGRGDAGLRDRGREPALRAREPADRPGRPAMTATSRAACPSPATWRT